MRNLIRPAVVAQSVLITAALGIGLRAWAAEPSPSMPRKNEAILFGGVDNSTTGDNIFQASFVSLSKAMSAQGWDVEPLFGDGQACANCSSSWSVDPVAEAAGKSPADIPPASKAELLRKLDAAIQNLSSGDQLLVEFNTHGVAVPDLNSSSPATQQTVSLQVYADPGSTDPGDNFMKNSMDVNNPELVQRFQALKDKGVKLAFGEDSCFSGVASQVLEKYGCALTQTSAQKYGLGSPISNSIADLLNADPSQLAPVLVSGNGQASMEDVFMDTLSYSTYGVHSPYYTSPFAGVLEPEFSADLAQYDETEKLSASWLLNLKSNYLDLQNGELSFTGNPADFSILQDFSRTFLAPTLDPSKAAAYQAIARYYMKKNYGVLKLSDADIPTPSELAQDIANAPANLQAAAAQYNQLAAQERSDLADIRQSGLALDIQLPSDIAAAQPGFDAALTALNGHGIDLFAVSSGSSPSASWMVTTPGIVSTQAGWETKYFLVPSDPADPGDMHFNLQNLVIAGMIARKMAPSYPSASSQAFVQELAQAIGNAETQAWGSASTSTRASLGEIQQVEELRKQEQAIPESGMGERFVAYSILARMYSYLAYRDQAGRNDADVGACAGFALRKTN